MNADERLRALTSLPALGQLDPTVLEWLADVVHERTFGAGETLVYERSNTRECYFLLGGRTEDSIGGSRVGESGFGDIEGEIALLFETPRSATVRAIEPTETLVLSQTDFDDVTHAQPELAEALREALAAYLQDRFKRT
jgi:CRP-like cAMP-binding protein